MIKVTYLDHSGFAVTTPQAVMVFDYYKDPDRKLEKVLRESPEADVLFFVSHHHPDHFNASIFELAQDRKRTYILANDIFSKLVPDKGLSVAWMSPGDIIDQIPGTQKVQAFKSTDAGVAYAITLPDGKVIFHAGDLNDWHWSEQSTPAEVRDARAYFEKIVNRVAEEYPEMYVAMFPVDARMGADFAKGAKIFLQKVKVDNFFPMHFWGNLRRHASLRTTCPKGARPNATASTSPAQRPH